ncbi:MAG TPA: hypothetical protein GXZ86_00415 [Clostridiales bacterium]|jgi:hypothetical protein|nr:hypothetical protein [Clostridiales bacterium]
MKNHAATDERIMYQRRKIQSRGFAYLMLALWISAIVQQILKAPFMQYAVELFLLLAGGIYNIVANYRLGIDLWNAKERKPGGILLNAVITGGVGVTVHALISKNSDIAQLVLFFVFFVAFFFLAQALLAKMARKKQEAIIQKLEEDD